MSGSLDKTPVIILDCEQRSQEGIIPSFGRKGIPVIAVSSDPFCPAFRSRYISKKIVLSHVSNGMEAYIESLENLPFRGVLVYSSDVSAIVISQYRDRLKSEGFLLNIPDLATVLRVFDKWDCYNYVRSLNIPVAKTQIVENVDDVEMCWDDFRKPIILKGTRLAGGSYQKFERKEEIKQNFEKVDAEVSSEFNRMRNSKIILQEWLEYGITDQWSCETVYDQKSNPMGFFTIKRIRSSLNEKGEYTSRLYAGEHKNSIELKDMTREILSSVNWKGFAHVEFLFVPEEKKYYLTEVNPRLPGYSYYPSQAGYEMGYYYYADLVGISHGNPSSFPKSVYFEALRYPGDISSGIVQMISGNIKILEFIKSYLRLFERGTVKVIDPVKLDDPVFTLFSQLDNLKRFFKIVAKYIKKRIRLQLNR
jgi:predicted ATP-grasp superfamily ATP-dependent carboligase